MLTLRLEVERILDALPVSRDMVTDVLAAVGDHPALVGRSPQSCRNSITRILRFHGFSNNRYTPADLSDMVTLTPEGVKAFAASRGVTEAAVRSARRRHSLVKKLTPAHTLVKRLHKMLTPDDQYILNQLSIMEGFEL